MAFLSRYDGLRYLRLTPLGAYCLGLTERYEPAEPVAPERAEALRVEPDGRLVGGGPGVDPGERALLDDYAERVADDGWQLTLDTLLGAAERGRTVDELRAFMRSRGAGALPAEVERLLGTAAERAALLRDVGDARLIECPDEELFALIAGDPGCAKWCLPAGEHHLVVRAADEARFRAAVRALGYGVRGR